MIGLTASAILAFVIALCYGYRLFVTSKSARSETAYDRWVRQYGDSSTIAARSLSFSDSSDTMQYQSNPLALAALKREKNKFASLNPLPGAGLDHESVAGIITPAVNTAAATINPILAASGHNPMLKRPLRPLAPGESRAAAPKIANLEMGVRRAEPVGPNPVAGGGLFDL